MTDAADLGRGLPIGARHYRAYIGVAEDYDLVSRTQFNLLTHLGLREDHYLLDIGCGSLRGGRLFIAYLLPDHYFGIEPNQWLLEDGIEKELGKQFIGLKQPHFSHDANFTCSVFGQQFDFILAQAIFVHAAPGQIRRCMQEARQCMNPASLFVANFVEGDDNHDGSDWTYPGAVTYRLSWMREAATNAGLRCTPIEWFHPAAGIKWIVLTLPEGETRVAQFAAANEAVVLREELRASRKRINDLEKSLRHPYVQFGLKVKRLLRWIGRSGRSS
jgi:hypothetical protein